MRIAWGVTVVAWMLVFLPAASAMEQASKNYTGTNGVALEGFGGIAFVVVCTLDEKFPDVGCFGAAAVVSPSRDPYTLVEVSLMDAVSGPNVWAWACIPRPETVGGACIGAEEDVFATGCGVPLSLDASPAHDGNNVVKVAPHTFYVDPATNQVCVGFAGTVNVIFIE